MGVSRGAWTTTRGVRKTRLICREISRLILNVFLKTVHIGFCFIYMK